MDIPDDVLNAMLDLHEMERTSSSSSAGGGGSSSASGGGSCSATASGGSTSSSSGGGGSSSTTSTNLLPTFYASKVPALLNLQPFLSDDEAFLELLSNSPHYSALLHQTSQGLQLVALTDLLASSVPTFAPQTLRAIAKEATSSTALASGGETAVLTAAVAAAAPTIAALAQGDKNLEAKLTSEFQGGLNKAVGEVKEAKGLDDAGASRGTKITHRNDTLYSWVFGEGARAFRLCGRVDGLEACGEKGGFKLVEHKVRMKTKSEYGGRSPNIYDLAQVRVYLALLLHNGVAVSEGVLLETFACGGRRETEVKHDEALWGTIHRGLGDVSARYNRVTPEEVEALVKMYWETGAGM